MTRCSRISLRRKRRRYGPACRWKCSKAATRRGSPRAGPRKRAWSARRRRDDVWYKPYDHEHGSDYEKHARAYLSWEVALVDQIRRDPTIRFRAYR
ncbi:MAG: hypothetical protein K0S03_1070 [Burkholderiales bacterium]|nr:hypothetical protein [Burkholderiales bacterium]